MKRPVWLFSLDTEEFWAAPLTTGGLKAYFQAHGKRAAETDVDLVHFRYAEQIGPWLREQWDTLHVHRARQAVLRGLSPVVGFSVYTWNAAEFLEVVKHVRESCPGITVVAGGPHVQRPEDYLYSDGIDVVVLGEGEITFSEWLDCTDRAGWASVAGLAYLDGGAVVSGPAPALRGGAVASGTAPALRGGAVVSGPAPALRGGAVLVRTPERPRLQDLDLLPSALDVIELRDRDGYPKYKTVAYETARGCPFKCAFCEWGTGAIGTKFYKKGLARIRSDFERLIDGGIEDIWLADSNFGALPEDLDKAKIIVELRQRTGRPYSAATSWSKTHNARVQEIVVLLKEHGLLLHYNLALQTLTPLALKLSNRKNMRSNQYEPIAKSMAEQGITIATELIWGLPGDNLAEFERNLDRLAGVFTNINIFGFVLLPGTEFFERRVEYAIETIPVAGYGKAKGEYVVGCHTFDQDEGIEGYFLITAHILLVRGHVTPLLVRMLALDGGVPVSAFMRTVLRKLAHRFAAVLPGLDPTDRMAIYERRADIYLVMLQRLDDTFAAIRDAVEEWMDLHAAPPSLRARALQVLALDEAFCPRVGASHEISRNFDFNADRVEYFLGRMELPPESAFAPASIAFEIDHPAHVGEVLKNPDGGSWMRGQVRSTVPAVLAG